MLVIVSLYRAKTGEEDAIIALHEDWQRSHGPGAGLFLSWELFRKIDSPLEFIEITRFASEESAQTMLEEFTRDAWDLRLGSLIDNGLTRANWTKAWGAD